MRLFMNFLICGWLSACAAPPPLSSNGPNSRGLAEIIAPERSEPFRGTTSVRLPYTISSPDKLKVAPGRVWHSQEFDSAFLPRQFAQILFEGVRIRKGAHFNLVIQSDTETLTYSANEIRERLRNGRFATSDLYGQTFTVAIESPTVSDAVQFSISSVIEGRPAPKPDENQRSRFTGSSSSVGFLLNLFRNTSEGETAKLIAGINLASNSVGMFRAGGGYCTAFLIAEDLALTNYHCINNSRQFRNSKLQADRPCTDVMIDFGYLRRADILIPSPKTAKTHCEAVIAWSSDGEIGSTSSNPSGREPLDFALMQIDPGPLQINGEPRPWLKLRPGQPSKQKGFVVLHHPRNWELHLSDTCDGWRTPAPVANAPSEVFAHLCDTLGGSSGAPVMNTSYEVAALHFAGSSNAEDETLIMRLSEEEIGEIVANFATPIGPILEDAGVRRALRVRGINY